jgi:hypothetical protein
MTIYITGDIHGKTDFEKLQPRFFPRGPSLSEEDVLLVAGDFGLPVLPGNLEADYHLDDLASRKYTMLFIDGNHEHFELLARLRTEFRFKGPVGVLRPNVLHLRRGYVYEIGGLSLFAMGGARGMSNMAGYGFDSREVPSEKEFQRGLDSLEERMWKVDLVLTHAAPSRFLPRLYGNSNICPVSKFLDGIFERVSFRKWFCGHYHRDLDFTDAGFSFVNERILKLNSSMPPERGAKLKNCRAGLEEGRDWETVEGIP